MKNANPNGQIKVVALTRYGSLAASTRQRFLVYREHLAAHGVSLELRPLMGNDQVARIAQRGRASAVRGLTAYPARMRMLLRERDAHVLWIHSELFPFVPGWLERLAYGRRAPVVLEFDDAMFHRYDEHDSPSVRYALGGKFPRIMAAAQACICGNQYLLDYAEKWCQNSVIVPTVVDTDRYFVRGEEAAGPLAVGWIGSHSTWANVLPLLPTILQVCRRHGAEFRVVGAGPQAQGIDGVTAVAWSEAEEVAQLQRMDVGIMPLLDLPFQRGKCGYKLIQYMAVGLPVAASPIGVNREIVRDGVNGALAATPEEWTKALDELLGNARMRRNYGRAGRAIAEERYSVRANRDQVLEVLLSAAQRRAPK